MNLAERKADYWIFGGIFRPVWLEALPVGHIERIAIDAKADGSFSMDVFLEGIEKAKVVGAQITTMDGKPVGEPFNARVTPGSSRVNLHTQVKDPALWTSETPNRYIVQVALNSEVTHKISEKFGFRTIEVRKGDGIYVNGTKMIFKGVNRHSFWPASGRTTNKNLSIADVNLIKDMNMNAVRMSHYPPDAHFLDVCDSLGLFVIDELAGWQACYDSIVGRKLVKEMVVRDVNHPCIMLWANGNEGGWNRALDKDYAWYDLQKRQVIHPWENFDGINTDHYENYASTENLLFNKEEILMPTEFLHGLYDGGHGAGLNDYFNAMLKSDHSAGGFLWVFADEGVVRTDRNGEIDVAGNAAPDGIVGPYREKEGSFYAIKEIWSPIYVAAVDPAKTSGKIELENRYHFTNLKECTFNWSLKSINGPGKETTEKNITGKIASPDIRPGDKNILKLGLPKDWLNYDILSLKATDRFGREIYTWTWPIKTPAQKTAEILTSATTAKSKFTFYEDNSILEVKSGTFKVYFDKKTGKLSGVDNGKGMIPFRNGPSLTSDTAIYGKIKCTKLPDSCIVESINKSKLSAKWTIYSNNLIKLEYHYSLDEGEYDFMGVNFEFPEKDVEGMKWMGYGPYRVWKNRTKGVSMGLWEKEYNDTRTGDSWIYPEFKGYHRNFYWVTIKNKISDFTIYNASEEPLFLRMFTPSQPAGAEKTFTKAAFPVAGISFMHGISAMGTKFSESFVAGPESERYKINNAQQFSGTLYFNFQ